MRAVARITRCVDPGCAGEIARGSYCETHALQYYDLTRETARESAKLIKDAKRIGARPENPKHISLTGDDAEASRSERTVAVAGCEGVRVARRFPGCL